MAADQADTVIGAQVELKGSLHNHGPIQIHGKVIGDVASDELVVVGETAVITGPVVARQVIVYGQVHGPVTAEQLIEMNPKSLVKGDLTTNQLSIKPGAVFVGKCQMNSAPVEAAAAEEPASKRKPHLEVE
ncbi:polymer-forming cytoskeletal protein [Patescibacteria group bacterium]|nr:polymer-forming cytoskeletal protein [Patescibacteria group bacterium]